MSLTEKNIRNIFIYVSPKFIGYGINLVTIPILTRLLAPEDFGVVTMTMLFSTVGANVLTLGITSAAQRYYFEYKEGARLDALMYSSQVFLYSILVVSSIVIYFFRDALSIVVIGDTKYGVPIFMMFVSGYLGQIITFYLYMYQNAGNAVAFSIVTVIKTALVALLSVLLVWYFSLSYMGLIYANLLGPALVCAGLVYYFNRSYRFSLSLAILRDNIVYGLQIVPKSFTSFINMYFDKYMLNSLISLTAVGVYSIGQNVGNMVFYLISAIWSSFQPVYYKNIFDNGADASREVGRMFTVFIYISLAPLFLLMIFAGEALYILAPASYQGAESVIIIIVAGVATQTFGMWGSVQYAYTKKAYWSFILSVIGAFINILANIILIPRFGIIGAAASVAIGTTLVNCMFVYVGQRLYRISYEWGTVAALLVFTALAMGWALYTRTAPVHLAIVYLVKLLLIAVFFIIGLKARVITKNSVRKVLVSVGARL